MEVQHRRMASEISRLIGLSGGLPLCQRSGTFGHSESFKVTLHRSSVDTAPDCRALGRLSPRASHFGDRRVIQRCHFPLHWAIAASIFLPEPLIPWILLQPILPFNCACALQIQSYIHLDDIRWQNYNLIDFICNILYLN